jgi:hypothetical protein
MSEKREEREVLLLDGGRKQVSPLASQKVPHLESHLWLWLTALLDGVHGFQHL